MRVHRRTVSTMVVALVVISSLLLLSWPAEGHSGAAIDALWTSTAPTIDGAMDSGEWADAAVVDLGVIAGNLVPAFLLLKNNGSLLWIAYDATGDETEDSFDVASLAFDTGHDGVETGGREDQFVQGGWANNDQAHWVYSSSAGGWIEEDSPYDEGLPNHLGLSSAWGFGPSDRGAADHRIYEFQVPLVLLGIGPGDAIGLFGGSWPAPGVFDETVSGWSTWPEWVSGPIPLGSYGDLILDSVPGPVDVAISPSSATRTGFEGETVGYNLTVWNKGTFGGDTFDMTYDSSWPLTLWDVTGTVPLTDTDSDGVPDTGNLSTDSSVGIVAKVSIPSNVTGCSTSVITATSSRNTSISDGSNLTTCTTPAGFLLPHSDFGLDTDGDGLFNHLVVNASVRVEEAGTYFVYGVLHDPTFTLWIDASNFTMEEGLQTVPLWFDGVRVNTSGVDGPYIVELSMYEYENFTFLDSDIHATANYSHLEFQSPPGYFSPPHSDFGLDTDGDALFNSLVVNATIQVEETGTYRVEGVLYESTSTLFVYTSNVTSLDVGLQTVPLWFDGVRINASDVDGPYTVDLTLHDYDTFTFLDSDTHTTAAYSHLDFDGPPASFAPPHSDHGLDTDGDGLFEYLVVDLNIQVTEAGTFFVEAILYGSHIAETFNITTLEPGLQTVPLWFDGLSISSSGIDGPYTVDLALYEYETFIFLDSDTHTTAAYSHLDFEEPEPTFRVGTILSLTGVLGSYGLSMRDAADLAAADINAVGGVLGNMLELLHRDSQTDPVAGSDAAEELIFEEGVPAIIGAVSSGVSLPVAEVTIPNEVVQISPSSTSPVFTTLESEEPGWFWRTIASDALEGRVAAMRSIERGWTRVGILVADNPWPLWEVDAFRESFTGEGRSVVVQVNYTEGQGDYISDLQIIADTAPDAVFFMGFPGDGLPILQNWEANRAQPGWDWDWLFWQGLKSSSLMSDLRDVGVDITGVEGTAPIVTGPNYEAFRTEYLDRYGRDPMTFDAHTYDAVYLTALAAVAGQAGDSLSIRDNLISVANPPGSIVGPGPEEFERAVGILEAGGEINYEGASSLVNFDQVGDVGSSFEVWQVTQDYDIVQVEVIPESQIWPPSLDSTPPTVAISSPLAGAILPTGDVLVSWSANDFESGIDRIEVSLDGGMPAVLVETETTHTFTGVTDGSHTITATAFDVAGNSQIASVDFAVDTTPPTVSMSSPTSGAFIASGTVEVAWAASDAVSGVERIEVALDGGVPLVLTATETSTTLQGLAEGSHTVMVTAVDVAGFSQVASVDFTVDTASPTIAITSPSSGTHFTTSSVEVDWTASDQTSGIDHFEVSLDGGDPVVVSAETSSHILSVGDGSHTITVTAVDQAGNSEGVSVDVTVDTNIFSPTGPVGILPLVGIGVAVAAAGVILYLLFIRKRSSNPPP